VPHPKDLGDLVQDEGVGQTGKLMDYERDAHLGLSKYPFRLKAVFSSIRRERGAWRRRNICGGRPATDCPFPSAAEPSTHRPHRDVPSDFLPIGDPTKGRYGKACSLHAIFLSLKAPFLSLLFTGLISSP
jgi:hypothetical protein